MKASYVLLTIFIVLLSACISGSGTHEITQRDTTITRANAFSELFMDSIMVETFIREHRLEDSAAGLMRNFYNSRNYQFAWFTEDGLAEQARAFWNLHNNYIQLSTDSAFSDKGLHKQMELFVNEDTPINTAIENVLQTELALTEHFFEYAQYAYTGKVDPGELQWHIPRKKLNAMALLDSLILNKGQNIEQWEPVNKQYKLMYKELKRYYEIAKAGGWEEISSGRKKNYKQGDSAIAIKQVKQRLSDIGDYSENDTSQRFTSDFIAAVKQAQKRYGYKQDGVIGADLIKDLNVPVKNRIEQMLINMERMRWMPKDPQGSRIVVNIPEYKMHVLDGTKKVFDMDIVVGTSANRTVIFNDTLKYVVFSPYWNIPRSIVRNEILPGIRKSANYLARKNMEQTGFINGLPVIRQKPGDSNALGRVKFIFPNSYSIYFHDTPSKSLFKNKKRAFSHGCIRLAQPKKMAEYLLQNQPEWTAGKINEAMNASKEKWVSLKEPVPVIITYFTSWISNDGLLNFREDIYGHDKKMAERLFEM